MQCRGQTLSNLAATFTQLVYQPRFRLQPWCFLRWRVYWPCVRCEYLSNDIKEQCVWWQGCRQRCVSLCCCKSLHTTSCTPPFCYSFQENTNHFLCLKIPKQFLPIPIAIKILLQKNTCAILWRRYYLQSNT